MNAFGEAFVYLNDPFNWTRPNGDPGPAGRARTDLGARRRPRRTGRAAARDRPRCQRPRRRGDRRPVQRQPGGARRWPCSPSSPSPRSASARRRRSWPWPLFAVPPMLTNTFVGFREVDRDVREAARAMGMARRQVIAKVEFPLAVPLIMTGVRTAAVQVVATATLAALVGGGGLGRIINLGFGQQDYGADHRRRPARRRPRAAHRGAARRPLGRAHPRAAAVLAAPAVAPAAGCGASSAVPL